MCPRDWSPGEIVSPCFLIDMTLNNDINGAHNNRVVIMITEIFYAVALCISSSSIPKIHATRELKKNQFWVV